jgi:hypothetical protein
MEREYVFWSGSSGCAIGCLAVLVGFVGVLVIVAFGHPPLVAFAVMVPVMAGISIVSVVVDGRQRKERNRTAKLPPELPRRR